MALNDSSSSINTGSEPEFFSDLEPKKDAKSTAVDSEPSFFGVSDYETPIKRNETLTQDVGTKLEQGVVGLGQAAAGLGALYRLPTEGISSSLAAKHAELEQELSPETQAQNKTVQDTKGFLPTAGAYLQNPRALLAAGAESLPGTLTGMGASGLVAKGIFKEALQKSLAGSAAEVAAGNITKQQAAKAAREAGLKAIQDTSKMTLIAPGAAAEGLQTTGAIADQGVEAGRSHAEYAAPAVIGGALTAGVNLASGKLFGDVATDLATGAKTVTAKTTAGKVAKETATEAGEENLQSGQEQVNTNIALGKENIYEGVPEAMAAGTVLGGAMGGTFGGASAVRQAISSIGGDKPDAGIATKVATRTLESGNADPNSVLGNDPNARAARATVDPNASTTVDPNASAASTTVDPNASAASTAVDPNASAASTAVDPNASAVTRVSQAAPKATPVTSDVTPSAGAASVQDENSQPAPDNTELETAPRQTLGEAQDSAEYQGVTSAPVVSPEDQRRELYSQLADAIGNATPAERFHILRTASPESPEYQVASVAHEAAYATKISGKLSGIRDTLAEGKDLKSAQKTQLSSMMANLRILDRGTPVENVRAVSAAVTGILDKAVKVYKGEHVDPVQGAGIAEASEGLRQSQGVAARGQEAAVAQPKEPAKKQEAFTPATPETPIDFAVQTNSPTHPGNNLPVDFDPKKNQKANAEFQGIPVAIENAKGSERYFKKPDGTIGYNTQTAHYGEIPTTEGFDGDPVDVFIPEGLTKDDILKTTHVYIIDQIDPETGLFDEHKVVMGVRDANAALDTYSSNYDPDWKGAKSVHEMPIELFKEWVLDGQNTRKPLDPSIPVKSQPAENLNDQSQNATTQETETPEQITPAVPEVQNAVPEVQNAVPEVQNAVPEVQNAVPEVQNAVPEVQNAVPEVQNAVPEQQTAVPEQQTAVPEQQTAVPEQQTAVPEAARSASLAPVIAKYLSGRDTVRVKPSGRGGFSLNIGNTHVADVPEYTIGKDETTRALLNAYREALVAEGVPLQDNGDPSELLDLLERQSVQNSVRQQTARAPAPTEQEARSILVETFGLGINRLFDQGIINFGFPPHLTKAIRNNAEGVHVRSEGKVYLNLHVLSRDRLAPVVLHELGEHYGLRKMIGDKEYRNLINQIRNLAKIKGSLAEATWNVVKAQYKDIEQEGSDRFVSEVIARLGENNPNLPWYRRLLSKVKAFLIRIGIGRGFIRGTLTDKDIHELLRASLFSSIDSTENVREYGGVQEQPAYSYKRSKFTASDARRAFAEMYEDSAFFAVEDELFNRVLSDRAGRQGVDEMRKAAIPITARGVLSEIAPEMVGAWRDFINNSTWEDTGRYETYWDEYRLEDVREWVEDGGRYDTDWEAMQPKNAHLVKELISIHSQYERAMNRLRPGSALGLERFVEHILFNAETVKFEDNSYIFGQTNLNVFTPTHFAPATIRGGARAIEELNKHNTMFAVPDDLAKQLEKAGYYVIKSVTEMRNFRGEEVEKRLVVAKGSELYKELSEEGIEKIAPRVQGLLHYLEQNGGIPRTLEDLRVQHPQLLGSQSRVAGLLSGPTEGVQLSVQPTDDIFQMRKQPLLDSAAFLDKMITAKEAATNFYSDVKSEGYRKALTNAAYSKSTAALGVYRMTDSVKHVLPGLKKFQDLIDTRRGFIDKLMHDFNYAVDKWGNAELKEHRELLNETMQNSTTSDVNASLDWTGVMDASYLRNVTDNDIHSFSEIRANQQRTTAYTQAELSTHFRNRIAVEARRAGAISYTKFSATFETEHEAQAFVAVIQQIERDMIKTEGVDSNAPRKVAHAKVKHQYDSLPLKAQAIYELVHAQLERSNRLRLEALEDRISESILEGKRRSQAIASLRQAFEANSLKWYYAPLGRFGDYWLYAKMENGEPHFQTFDSQNALDKGVEQFQADNPTAKLLGQGMKMDALGKDVSGPHTTDAFLTELFEVLQQAGLDSDTYKQITDEVYQRYLAQLPEISMRHRSQHRSGATGFEKDQLRSTAFALHHSANQIGNMLYGSKMVDVLKDSVEAIKMAQRDDLFTKGKKAIDNLNRFADAVKDNNGSAADAVENLKLDRRELRIKLKEAVSSGSAEDESALIEQIADLDDFISFTDSFKDLTLEEIYPAIKKRMASIESSVDQAARLRRLPDELPWARDVVKELALTQQHITSPTTSSLDGAAQTLRGLSYIFTLGFSISSAIVNLLQTVVVAIPVSYGYFTEHGVKKTLAMYSEISKYGFEAFGTWDGAKDADGNRSLSEVFRRLESEARDPQTAERYRDMREALEVVKMNGDISRSMTWDLIAYGNEGEHVDTAMQGVGKLMGSLFYAAERVNREITFMANYNLAREQVENDVHSKTGKPLTYLQKRAKAVEISRELTRDAHGDYSPDSSARMFRGPIAAVALQFKKYPVMMYVMWGKNFMGWLNKNKWKDLPETTPEEVEYKAKRQLEAQQAARTFTALLGAQAAFAGAYSLPLSSTISAAATAVMWVVFQAMKGLGLRDDDDESVDFKRWVHVSIAQNFGEQAATLVTKGVVNAFTPINLSSRTDLASVFFREPLEDLKGEDLSRYYMSQIFGVAGGVANNVMEGASQIAQGRTERGVEMMLPKFLKDVFKTYRYSDEGATSRSGMKVAEVSTPELVLQLFGFGSSNLDVAFTERGYIKNAETQITEKRAAIKSRIVNDILEGATPNLEELQAWNKRHPEWPIGIKDIHESVRSKLKHRAASEGRGYEVNPKLGHLYEKYRVRD